MLPCELSLPPERVGPDLSKMLCTQNFPSLVPAVTGCFGDSGGPMLLCEGDRIVVIGVSSFQWNPAGARCQKETTVGAYVEVQAHLSWIREKTGEGNKKLE